MSPNYTTIGIVTAASGNVLISIALNLQRYAHLRIASLHPLASHLKSPLWWFGILLMTIGELGNFIAYGLAPASLVSPLGVFALVSNSIIAPLWFSEPLSKYNIFGVGLCVVGILSIVFSPEQNGNGNSPPPLTSDDIIALCKKTGVQIYLLVTCSVLTVLIFWFYFQSHTDTESSTTSSSSNPAPVLFPSQTTSSLRPQLSHVSYLSHASERRQSALTKNSASSVVGLARSMPMSLTLVTTLLTVALLGAYTAVATKCLSGLLEGGISSAARSYITYELAFIIIVTAISQVHFLNLALKCFSSTVVVPVHFVFFTVSVIIASAIAFDDFADRSPKSLLAFGCGCFLTFVGVWFIASNVSVQPKLPSTRDPQARRLSTKVSRGNLATNGSLSLTSQRANESEPLLSVSPSMPPDPRMARKQRSGSWASYYSSSDDSEDDKPPLSLSTTGYLIGKLRRVVSQPASLNDDDEDMA